MQQFEVQRMKADSVDWLDAVSTELSRASGPMLFVFSVTAVGWLLLHLA